MPGFGKHIFICENKRKAEHLKGCCTDRGSSEIHELFKKRLKELGLSTKVWTNSSGCLDACEFGPTVVIYQGQIWYGGIKPKNVEEIIQKHIIHNQPVEKLLI